MTYFDRHDICAAHELYAALWNIGGLTTRDRMTTRAALVADGRRSRSACCILSRLRYRGSTLTENAAAIFLDLVERYEGRAARDDAAVTLTDLLSDLAA